MKSDFGHFLHILHGDVSNATIQGYLRSASQIEDIWQQIDTKVEELIAQGMPPWEAYSQMAYALAFVRACRTNVVFVQELLGAATSSGATTTGYLPKLTYDQALALCQNIEPLLEESILALTRPHYSPTAFRLPLILGPRLVSMVRTPVSHLRGILAAGRETREWAAGLLATYELALGAAKIPIPQAVTTHVEHMRSQLRLGDFHLQTGVDLVGQISRGQVPDDLAKSAEDILWEAIQDFFLVGQLIAAYSGSTARQSSQPPVRSVVTDQRVRREQPAPAVISPSPPPPAPPPPPRVSDVLGQLQMTAGATVSAHPQALPETSDVLGQFQMTTSSSVPTPPQSPSEASDVLGQFQMKTGSSVPTPPQASPEASDMLSQLQMTADSGRSSPSSSSKSSEASRKQPQEKSVSGEEMGDMFSD